MYKRCRTKTSKPERTFLDGRRDARKDWGRFLWSMREIFGFDFEWLQFDEMNEILRGGRRDLWEGLAQDIVSQDSSDCLSLLFD